MSRHVLWLLLNVTLIPTIVFSQTPSSIQQARFELGKQKQAVYEKLIACNKSQTPNQQQYDVRYYALDLHPDPDLRILSGTVDIHAVVVDEPLVKLELNLLDNMNVSRVYLLDSLHTSLAFIHANNMLVVTLDHSYMTDEWIRIGVQYNGQPRHSFGFNTQDGQPMIWSLSEPFGARAWWPCKDIPADKADSVDIRITVPSRLIVASNGTLREKTISSGKTTYWWHEQYPIVTYLVSVAIHPYTVTYDHYLYNNSQDTMAIHFYMFPSHANDLKPGNAMVKQMIAAFADLFGEYPFVEEKYGQADFLGGGAMEHQTCSSFSFWGEWVYAHELAHQWWGDMITCHSFHHIWLNEGFATYSEALWYEYQHGPGMASLYQMQNNLYYGPGTVYVEDPDNDNIFHGGLSYSKGSWVLHQLRHIVGDSTFFQIIRTYYASPAHQYGTATTEEFQSICEQLSGKDLSTYFHQWIYEEGFPKFEYFWTKELQADGSYLISGMVSQIQELGPVFELPIDMKVETDSGDTTFILNVDKKREPFQYVLRAKPTDVKLDPDNWILKTVHKIDQPNYSLQGIIVNDDEGNGNGFAEPGERVQMYLTIWNTGLEAQKVSWQLSTEDSFISVRVSEVAFDKIEMGSSVSNSDSPFIFDVDSAAFSHQVRFLLTIRDADGYEDIIEFQVAVGMPDVLLVDDDDGQNYEMYIDPMLRENGVLFDIWDVSTKGTPDSLERFRAVVWFTGDDRSTTFTAEEQTVVRNFLKNGGRLLVSGQDIGYDLAADGNNDDRSFFSEALKAVYVADSADDPWITGVSGDVIGHQQYAFLTGVYPSADNQTSTDVIEPAEGAIPFMEYAVLKKTAGIHYHDDITGAKLVYLAFGLEGIAGPNPASGVLLMKKILDWLTDQTQTTVHQPIVLNSQFRLEENFPNPFNPETVIRYSVPKSGNVSVVVFNLNGQHVKTLVSASVAAGTYRVTWHGDDDYGNMVPSGVYVYRLEANGFVQTRKMVLVR